MAEKEATKKNLSFRDFKGVNTQPVRQMIDDNEFAWLENVMPIGYGNVRTVPAPSAALATLSAGKICYYMAAENIAAVNYMIMFCTDGSAYAVNLVTNAVTTIAEAMVFSNSGVRITQWKNERILIVDPNNGYYDWDGTTRTLLDATKKGTTIATYAGRVWIGNNRTVIFTAADSYTNFAGTGGSFIMTESTLHSNIYRLFSANDFLYIFGIDSVNVLANVQVVGGITTFSNANILTGIGTDMPDSIVAYHRTLMFATDYGMYGLNGVTPTKLSDHLDGMYPYIDLMQTISSGIVSLFNILCLAYLVKYNDPLTATVRQIMAIYFNKKWFFSSQVSGMTYIAPALYNDIPSMYATDGASGSKLYRLFDDTTASISQTIITKFWDMGNSLVTKQVFKFGMETTTVAAPANFTIGIDSRTRTQTYTTTASTVWVWHNNAGQVIAFLNNLGQAIVLFASGYIFIRQDVENTGNYLGVTVASSSPGITYSGFHLQYEPRTPWTWVPW